MIRCLSTKREHKNMHSFEQIQTSKITKESIYNLNHYVLCTSKKNKSIGKAYKTLEFTAREKYSKEFPWKYKINQYGYRGNDWSFEKSPAFFGCSFTFGIGVEHSVAEIMQAKTNKIIPNLGMPGASVINIIKTFVAFSQLHPIDYAFISLPPVSRFYKPIFQYNQWNSINLIPGFHDNKEDKQIFKMWTNTTDVAYTVDYIDWAESVAKNLNIKIYWSSWDIETVQLLKNLQLKNIFNWPHIENNARDDLHPGQTTHEKLAESCLRIIK